MLLKIPNITVDDADILKDIKVNIINKTSFRGKCTIISGDDEQNIDLAIKDFKCNLTVSGIQATFIGINMIDKGSVSLALSYAPFKRKWSLDGIYGSKQIHTVFTSAKDVQDLVTQIK